MNEDGIDFSNRDVTITDSSGATATIVTADIATGTTAVDTTGTEAGAYPNVYHRLGEDLVRFKTLITTKTILMKFRLDNLLQLISMR